MLNALLLLCGGALAFETSGAEHLEIKWVRDSVEYELLTRQVFLQATARVQEAAPARPRRGERWVVVLDIDETTLDTSAYWLERAAYGQLFDWPSWDHWCERRDAPLVPGVDGFVAAVRKAGGRIAWITNRHERTRQATVDNLAAHGLWDAGDPLCMLTSDEAYTKAARRAELTSGEGRCGGTDRHTVVAYLGDAIGDFPSEEEGGPRAEALGVRDFVLPNPMYGSWEHGVTRRRQAR